MSYQLATAKQVYGDKDYLAHKIVGATAIDDRYLFAERVKAFGIIDFGAFAQGQSKRIPLSVMGITSQILVTSTYSYSSDPANDTIAYRLFSGNTQLYALEIESANMPYTFPPGAIVDPTLSIEIYSNKVAQRILVYWQPVHVLKYYFVS